MSEDEDKKTILVVEDNPSNMKLAVDILKLNGFQVIKAMSGKEALDILEKKRPDLILLDIQMPYMDGYTVFKTIRKNKEFDSIKIVAFTAHVMKEDIIKMKEIGFDSIFFKPIEIDEFIKEIKNLIN